MTQVYIAPGKRNGRTLQAEAAFRRAIEAGSDVVTQLNGVWFQVSIDEAGGIVYTAMTKKPEGL